MQRTWSNEDAGEKFIEVIKRPQMTSPFGGDMYYDEEEDYYEEVVQPKPIVRQQPVQQLSQQSRQTVSP